MPSLSHVVRAVILALLLALAPGSSAAPTPGVEQVASVVVKLTAGRHVWTVRVEAFAPTPASPLTSPRVRLMVQDGPPSAVEPSTVYETVLTANEVKVGTDTASLTTRLGGVPLTITWVLHPGIPSSITIDTATVGAGQGAYAFLKLGTSYCQSDAALIGARLLSLMDLQAVEGTTERAFTSKQLRGARCSPVA